jgi:hypothetical protein
MPARRSELTVRRRGSASLRDGGTEGRTLGPPSAKPHTPPSVAAAVGSPGRHIGRSAARTRRPPRGRRRACRRRVRGRRRAGRPRPPSGRRDGSCTTGGSATSVQGAPSHRGAVTAQLREASSPHERQRRRRRGLLRPDPAGYGDRLLRRYSSPATSPRQRATAGAAAPPPPVKRRGFGGERPRSETIISRTCWSSIRRTGSGCGRVSAYCAVPWQRAEMARSGTEAT